MRDIAKMPLLRLSSTFIARRRRNIKYKTNLTCVSLLNRWKVNVDRLGTDQQPRIKL